METFKKFVHRCNLVFVCIALCFTIHVDATHAKGSSTIIWSNNTHISSSGIIYARNGSSLELNCTVNNKSVSSLGWKNHDGWLNNVVKKDNVIQLKIDQVTWALNATVYWCGPRNTSLFDIQGAQVTVIVGDIPSHPRNPSYEIYGLDKFEIHVKWEPALYVGQLPTHYKVTCVPCYNDTFCGHALEFCITPHLPGKVLYHCKKLRQELMVLIHDVVFIRDLFHVTIATVNAVGESKAPSFILDADYGGEQSPFLPTPLPPKLFQVTSRGSDKIELSWSERMYWVLYDRKYTILYHSVTEHRNKTKTVHKKNGEEQQQVVTLSDGIQPYTKYYFYITVVLIDNNTSSGPSVILGPESVQTDEGTPLQGPNILKMTSNVYSDDTSKRNVTIVWEELNQSSWQGKPSLIKVYYQNINNQSTILVKNLLVTHSVPSNATLTGMSSTDPYYSYITLCNTKPQCGVMGPKKIIEPAVIYTGPENQRGLSKDNNVFVLGAVLSAIGVVLVITTILTCRWYRKRLDNKTKPASLESDIGEIMIIYGNGYQDVLIANLDDNDYQTPQI